MNEVGFVLIGIIIGASQMAKGLGVKCKYIPLLNLALGLILSAFIMGFNSESLLQGLIVGLSASGLYDQTKIMKGVK